MRDMKNERVEPRIGNERASTDGDKAARRNRAAESDGNTRRDTETSHRIVRDVLLDSPSSRYVPPDVASSAQASARSERGFSTAPSRVRSGKQSVRQQAVANETRFWRGGSFSWINRKLGVVVFAIGLCWAVYWLSEPVAKIFERPIKSVVVEGNFNFITKQRATELISNEIDGDFLQLDLMQLKNALLSDPWVEKVTLNRRWPDTLVVKITEQKPIARWGDGFLNQRGEIILIDEASKLSGLPWLQGSEADAGEILQQYQDLSQLLRSRGLEVIALKCDNKKSWRLTIKNHVEIALGRDQVMEKMRRFVTVYDTHLSNVWLDVKAIDLRYTNGIAVRWVADSAMAKKYIKSKVPANPSVPAL
jgi:cell division protein FtsQ